MSETSSENMDLVEDLASLTDPPPIGESSLLPPPLSLTGAHATGPTGGGMGVHATVGGGEHDGSGGDVEGGTTAGEPGVPPALPARRNPTRAATRVERSYFDSDHESDDEEGGDRASQSPASPASQGDDKP